MIALVVTLIGIGARRRPCRRQPGRPAPGRRSWRHGMAVLGAHLASAAALGLAVGAGIALLLHQTGLL